MPVHVVRPGDTLSGSRGSTGIKSWQELYNHPLNTAFREKHPNPNLIFPGDRVNIPANGGCGVRGGRAAYVELVGFVRWSWRCGWSCAGAGRSAGPVCARGGCLFLAGLPGSFYSAVFIFDRPARTRHPVRPRPPLSEIKGVVPIITKVKEGDKFIRAVLEPGEKLGLGTQDGEPGREGRHVCHAGHGAARPHGAEGLRRQRHPRFTRPRSAWPSPGPAWPTGQKGS